MTEKSGNTRHGFDFEHNVEVVKIKLPKNCRDIESMLIGCVYVNMIRFWTMYNQNDILLVHRREGEFVVIQALTDRDRDDLLAFRETTVRFRNDIGLNGMDIFSRSRIRLVGLNKGDRSIIEHIAITYFKYWSIRSFQKFPKGHKIYYTKHVKAFTQEIDHLNFPNYKFTKLNHK